MQPSLKAGIQGSEPDSSAQAITEIHRPVGEAISKQTGAKPRSEIGRSEGNASKPATRLSLSEQARAAMASAETSESLAKDASKPSTGQELSEEEKQMVEELKARDAEVRTHEQAHVAAGGQYINGPIHYEYQRGPDNKRYAIGGHVNIDTAPIEGDPKATIQKAEVVRRAALAPAEPSGADRAVAAKAMQTMAQARSELAKQESDESSEAAESNAELTSASAAQNPKNSEVSEGKTAPTHAAPSQSEAGPVQTTVTEPAAAPSLLAKKAVAAYQQFDKHYSGKF